MVLLIVILTAFLKNYPDMCFYLLYSLMRLWVKHNVQRKINVSGSNISPV